MSSKYSVHISTTIDLRIAFVEDFCFKVSIYFPCHVLNINRRSQCTKCRWTVEVVLNGTENCSLTRPSSIVMSVRVEVVQLLNPQAHIPLWKVLFGANTYSQCLGSHTAYANRYSQTICAWARSRDFRAYNLLGSPTYSDCT